MGKQRRRHKVTVPAQTAIASDTSEGNDVCESCRLAQMDGHQGKYGRKHYPTTKDSKQKDILKFLLLDCESETDSAIDIASVSGSSDNISIASASDSAADYCSLDEACRIVSIPKKGKVAEVSIIDVEKEEAKSDLAALAEFVTGIPLQKFTTRDSCKECIESYQRAVHIHQHNQMQMCGVDDFFAVDLSGLDMEVHIEEFTNWSFGSTTIQTKEHGYYVSPQGATYYTDIPMDTKLLSLPRQLMIPPSERSMCKLLSSTLS